MPQIGSEQNDKLGGELDYWKGMVKDLTQNCSTEEEKRGALLRVCHERTFKRYKFDLYLNDDSFNSKKILDLACGPHCGIIGFQGAEKYGVDHLIDEYKKIGYPLDDHGVVYRNAKSEQIPFPNDYFDVVLCVNALDHVDDVCCTLKEVFRVLKPFGKFLGQVNFHKTPTVNEPNCLIQEELISELMQIGFNIIDIKYQLTLTKHDENRYYYELSKGLRQVSYDKWYADLYNNLNLD